MMMAPLIGHRGCAGHAPENTLASIHMAAQMGCGWIEADASLLGDGSVILFHDDTLDRCTNGAGPIENLTWADVRLLDAGAWWGTERKYAGANVPLLSEALMCCKSLGLGFNIELKVRGDEGEKLAFAVGEILKTVDHGPVLISSFDMDALQAFAGDAPKGLLYDILPDDWEKTAQNLDAQTVHLWAEKATQDQVDVIKHTGRAVYLFTINDKSQMKLHNVDGVFTDFPDRIAEDV